MALFTILRGLVNKLQTLAVNKFKYQPSDDGGTRSTPATPGAPKWPTGSENAFGRSNQLLLFLSAVEKQEEEQALTKIYQKGVY